MLSGSTGAQGRRRELFRGMLVVVATLILGAAVSEAVLRVLRPQPTYATLTDLVGSYYAPSPFNAFTLKAGYRGTEPSMENPGARVRVSVNSLGLRGKETTLDKPPGTRRVLILGDSYTFGVYVNDEETYAAVLERELQSGAARPGERVEVLNAGYADGWEPDEMYAWLGNAGLKFRPDIVVYGFFVGNDIWGIRRERWKEVDRRGLPVRIVDDQLRVDEFGRIRSTKADEKTVGTDPIYRYPLLRDSHLAVGTALALKRLARSRAAAEGPAAGALPPWSSIYFPQLFGDSLQHLAEASPAFAAELKLRKARIGANEPVLLDLVAGMRDLSEGAGARFLVLLLPFNFQVEPDFFMPRLFVDPLENGLIVSGKVRLARDFHGEFAASLERMRVPSLDALRLMRATPGEKYYPRNGEVHFNANGHRMVARELKDAMKRLGWL